MSWPGFVGDPSSEVWVWVRGGQSGHHHQRQPSAMGLRPPTPAENKGSGIEEPLRYYSIVSFGRCLSLQFLLPESSSSSDSSGPSVTTAVRPNSESRFKAAKTVFPCSLSSTEDLSFAERLVEASYVR